MGENVLDGFRLGAMVACCCTKSLTGTFWTVTRTKRRKGRAMNSQLCSVRLVPEEGDSVSNLQIASTMRLLEKQLHARKISVAQILVGDRMFCGIVEPKAATGIEDRIAWTEIPYDVCEPLTDEEG